MPQIVNGDPADSRRRRFASSSASSPFTICGIAFPFSSPVRRGRRRIDRPATKKRRSSRRPRSALQSQRSGLLVGSTPTAVLNLQSQRSGLNRRPLDYESSALPLSYAGDAAVYQSCLTTTMVHALARTRTVTPCGTTPSRWRVYQFHHQGPSTAAACNQRSAIRESEFQFQTSPLAVQHGSDGARTRDLSSDSRVL